MYVNNCLIITITCVLSFAVAYNACLTSKCNLYKFIFIIDILTSLIDKYCSKNIDGKNVLKFYKN